MMYYLGGRQYKVATLTARDSPKSRKQRKHKCRGRVVVGVIEQISRKSSEKQRR